MPLQKELYMYVELESQVEITGIWHLMRFDGCLCECRSHQCQCVKKASKKTYSILSCANRNRRRRRGEGEEAEAEAK